jgi:hypothetical protein
VADASGFAGVGVWVSFRKKGCGIEGKWKGGNEEAGWVPEFSRFPQRVEKGMWNYGFGGCKGRFGAGFARV